MNDYKMDYKKYKYRAAKENIKDYNRLDLYLKESFLKRRIRKLIPKELYLKLKRRLKEK